MWEDKVVKALKMNRCAVRRMGRLLYNTRDGGRWARRCEQKGVYGGGGEQVFTGGDTAYGHRYGQ